MKGIHAISAIFAVRGMGHSAPATANHACLPARKSRVQASSHEGGGTPSGRGNSKQSRVGVSNLLADALLQGGSSSERRR